MGRTCRSLHMMSEIVQTWHECLWWACPPSCKSWGHYKHVKKYIMFNRGCSDRPEGSVWEHLVSRHPKFIPWPSMRLIWSIIPVVWVFWLVLHFLEFSRWKKADEWPDVSQLASVSGMNSYHWHVHLLNWKKLRPFQRCRKIDHVERRAFA